MIGALVVDKRKSILCVYTFVWIILEMVFRIREYSDKSIDFQIVLKMGMFVGVFVYVVTRDFEYICSKVVSNISALLFFALLVFFLLSSGYSENSLYSFVAGFSLLSMFVFSCVVSREGEAAVFKYAINGGGVFLIISFIYYFFLPELGRLSYWEYGVFIEGGRMSGAAASPNSLGLYSGLILLISMISVKHGWRIKLSMIVFALALCALLLSGNRFSLALSLFICFVVFYEKRFVVYYFALLLLFAVFILAFVLVGDISVLSRSGAVEELLTFTGRTYIWSVVVSLVQDSPYIGYGYGAPIGIFSSYVEILGFLPSSAHNIFLQVLLSVGVGGVFIFVLAIFSFFQRNKISEAPALLMIYGLGTGLLESGAFNGVANICSFAMFLAVFLNNEKK